MIKCVILWFFYGLCSILISVQGKTTCKQGKYIQPYYTTVYWIRDLLTSWVQSFKSVTYTYKSCAHFWFPWKLTNQFNEETYCVYHYRLWLVYVKNEWSWTKTRTSIHLVWRTSRQGKNSCVSIKQNKIMFIVLWPKNIKCAFVGMNGLFSDKHWMYHKLLNRRNYNY